MQSHSMKLVIAMATLVALAAVPARADLPDVDELLAATVATEQANTAHYADLVGQNAGPGYVTCRVDKPAFVSQPEIDGRVIVRGEDTAAATVECADAMLEAGDIIDGWVCIEYLPKGANPLTGWIRVAEADTPVKSKMNRGVGAAHGLLDYIFPAGHASQKNAQHRACIDVSEPNDYLPLCTVAPTLSKTTL